MTLTEVIPPVRVEAHLRQEVAAICDRKSVSVSEFVREALRLKVLEERARELASAR